MAKDARPDGVQSIVAQAPALDSLIAEVPVPRHERSLQVEDRSDGRRVDVRLAYVNADGEPVEVEVIGRMPQRPPRRRNGSTMGHSRQAVQAVLDLERFGTAGRARVHIDGRRVRLERALGLVAMRFLLQQAQGGIAVASFRQEPAPGGFTLVRPAGRQELDPATGQPGWPTSRVESWAVQDGEASWSDAATAHRYRFVHGGLASAEVRQAGRHDPVFALHIDPALPDLRRPWDGVARSGYRMDVNGQIGHGIGEISARWTDDDTVELRIRPTTPWWVADRPMQTTVVYEADAVVVQTVRVETAPAGPNAR